MEDKERLKKINIQLIRNVEGISFADKLEHSLIEKNEILLFFSNLDKNSIHNENIYNCINNYDAFASIESYLLQTLKTLREIYGDMFSEMIMMETINEYLSSSRKFKSVRHAVDAISKELNGLIITAKTHANLVAAVNERSTSDGNNHRFLYALALEPFGHMDGKVTYGVYPCFIKGTLCFCDVYTIKSAQMAIMLDFIAAVKENAIIKKCSNCGKYFTPTTRSDEIYCNNEHRNGKTCRQLGYEIKVNNDDFIKAYRTKYKTKHAQMKRKTENMDDEYKIKYKETYFDVWVSNAKKKLEEAQSGQITLEAFREWLKK